MPNDQKKSREVYDLCERTARFGEAVIAFAKTIPVNAISNPLISQLVRAATSIGANYCEADEAESKKEFRYRISLCNENRAKPNIRFGWLWPPSRQFAKKRVLFGRKPKSSHSSSPPFCAAPRRRLTLVIGA